MMTSALQNLTVPRTILVDGLWGTPSRLRLMRSRLERAGISNVETFAYRSSGFSCLMGEGARLAEFIAADPRPVNLVGYSMGGLVVRAAVLGCPDLPVNKVAFVNTPHRGSMLAHLLPGIGISQMRPGCDFLSRLESSDWPYPTLAVWTPGDLMVLPAHSARWEKATRVATCDVPAHVWPLFSGGLHREIAGFFLSE